MSYMSPPARFLRYHRLGRPLTLKKLRSRYRPKKSVIGSWQTLERSWVIIMLFHLWVLIMLLHQKKEKYSEMAVLLRSTALPTKDEVLVKQNQKMMR